MKRAYLLKVDCNHKQQEYKDKSKLLQWVTEHVDKMVGVSEYDKFDVRYVLFKMIAPKLLYPKGTSLAQENEKLLKVFKACSKEPKIKAVDYLLGNKVFLYIIRDYLKNNIYQNFIETDKTMSKHLGMYKAIGEHLMTQL